MTDPDFTSQPVATPPGNTSVVDSPLVRAPLQARSRRTLQKLLSAGVRILESDGPDGLTVGAITRTARISVGSFYARFQGKDDLLRFLGEGALEESLEIWTGRGIARGGAIDQVNDVEKMGPGREPARDTSEIDTALHTLLGLFLEGPGRTLALLEGVQDSSPSRRRRLEAVVTDEIAHLSGADPQRMGVRVRALVGLLQDAARRSVLGEAGAEEYGFLPEGEVLWEEGLVLLKGSTSEGQSEGSRRTETPLAAVSPPVGENPLAPERAPPKVAAIPLELAAFHTDEVSPEPEPEPVSEAQAGHIPSPAREDRAEPAPEPAITQSEAAPDADPEPIPPAPDPFDVWG